MAYEEEVYGAESYDLIESEGLFLAAVGGENYILDTGSPVSFDFRGKNVLELKTLPFELSGNLLGIKKEDMDKLAGVDVSGIIGLDLIGKYGLTLDRGTKKLIFASFEDEDFPSIPLQFRGLMGLGFLELKCEINGKEAKAIFDTGASVGYAHKSLLKDCECLGEIEDFGPSFGGKIKTKKYKSEILLGDLRFGTEFAEMTLAVESQLCPLGYRAIVGLNDFSWERAVIDPGRGKVIYC